MAIPTRNALLLPILQTLVDGHPYSTATLLDVVAERLKLTSADITTRARNGKKTVLKYEFNWATAYLRRAGLIEATKTGVFHITDAGHALLNEGHAALNTTILRRYPEFVAWLKNKNTKPKTDETPVPVAEEPEPVAVEVVAPSTTE